MEGISLEMLKVLSDLINRYLISTIDKSEMVEQLIGKISPSDVTEYEDELLNEGFFTIYHINGNYYDALNSEPLCLRACLEDRHRFSRVERDSIISEYKKRF
ncbi:hypothetical protein [Clostridium sp. CF012]|uniref:hypothetical protein n=1 Tax=Clostridium sp. CF012 TaxID=2843319 RepID=UPI001C0B584A|nr:hypothetical protein [Clostridium sp. CF012]MBU3146198.1 hypothetical protein [Clostridium sp. CF012]